MRKKLVLSMVVLFLVSQVGFAHMLSSYLETFLSKEAAEALAKEGKWANFGTTLQDLKNVPPEFLEEIKSRLKGDPTVTIETIFVAENPLASLRQTEELLRIENVLRSVSSLQGTEYFSPSRKKMRLLYEESHAVNNPNPKLNKRIDDQVVEAYGKGASRLYVFQKDLTFGENYYAWLYNTKSSDYLSVYITNLTSLNYSFIKLVDPQNLKTLVFIRPFEDKILFYGVSTVKTAKLMGLEKSRTESFYQRTEAMFNWFNKKIKEAAIDL